MLAGIERKNINFRIELNLVKRLLWHFWNFENQSKFLNIEKSNHGVIQSYPFLIVHIH